MTIPNSTELIRQLSFYLHETRTIALSLAQQVTIIDLPPSLNYETYRNLRILFYQIQMELNACRSGIIHLKLLHLNRNKQTPYRPFYAHRNQ